MRQQWQSTTRRRVGKLSGGRGDHIHGVDHEASPVTELTHDRLDHSSTVQRKLSEALPALLSLPSETSLLELGRQMLTGGTGAPAAPDTCFEPAEATPALLVLVWNVVSKLKKEHSQEFHIVPGTSGRIDAEESRGYLLGAVLGRGLLERTQAAAAGLDARNKKAAVEKRLGAEKEASRKAARKLSGAERERHTAAAAEERAALERAPIKLQLPPPPKPRSAAGRKCAPPPPPPPPPPEHDACLVAWCARNGWRPASLVSHMSRRVDACKRRERAWNPRGFDEVRRKVQRLQAVAAADELCTCSDGVPSILCRVNVCFATAAGATCEERVVPGMSCSCICWEDAEVVSIKDYHQNIKDFWIKDHRIFPGPPTPAGGWPPSDEAACRAASRARYEEERATGCLPPSPTLLPLPPGMDPRAPLACMYLAPEATPAVPAGVPVAGLLRVLRERPHVASAIKALISRKDLTEAQIMVGIQGLVAGTVAPTRSSERLVST